MIAEMNKKLKFNYMIKESWNFLGFEEGEDGWPVARLFGKPNDRFRIINRFKQPFWVASIDNVSRLGWPVANYKTEKISKKEAENLIANATWDQFYKCYKL